MGFQGLVQIQAGQAFHIETGEPHGAHEHNSEGVFRVFELLVQFPLLHLRPVRQNVQAPLFERLNLVLLLADDHGHFRFFQPMQLPFQLLKGLLGRCLFQSRFRFHDFFRPVLLNQIVHPYTGHLVQADKHGFSGSPHVGVVLYEISGNRVQSGLGRQNMDFLCKFPFQLFLLADIQIRRLDGIHDLLRDFRILDGAKLFTAVFIVQRHRCTVLYGAFKVIDGDIAAESAFCNGIVGKQGRAGETDPGRGRQQGHHIFRENTILAAVGFVGHDDNVIVRRNRRQALLIEFLNQREDEAGIAFQLMDEIFTALGYVLGRFHVSQHSAVFKGIADLRVQLLPVGEHHKSGRAVKFPADLLSQEQHGIALAASLGVPEHAQLAVSELALLIDLHRLVDTEILVVPGQNFGSVPAGVVKENEVLKQIHEIALVADASQHGFQGNRTFFVLF